jgi:hypothetical protein
LPETHAHKSNRGLHCEDAIVEVFSELLSVVGNKSDKSLSFDTKVSERGEKASKSDIKPSPMRAAEGRSEGKSEAPGQLAISQVRLWF